MDVKSLITLLLFPAYCGSVAIGQGCSAFPREIQFLCFQIGRIWGRNELSNSIAGKVQSTRADNHPAFTVNGVGQEDRKPQGCFIANCQSCAGVDTCQRCQPGYYTQFDRDTEKVTCVKKCFQNHVPAISSKGVYSCTEEWLMKCSIQRCMRCLDSMTCAKCTPGYYPQFHSNWEETICVKRCFSGYSLVADSSGNKTCKQLPVPKGCVTFRCTACRRGFYMLKNVTTKSPCKRRCPRGYLKDRIRRLCVRWPK